MVETIGRRRWKFDGRFRKLLPSTRTKPVSTSKLPLLEPAKGPTAKEDFLTVQEAVSTLHNDIKFTYLRIIDTLQPFTETDSGVSDSDAAFLDDMLLRLRLWAADIGLENQEKLERRAWPTLDIMLHQDLLQRLFTVRSAAESLSQALSDTKVRKPESKNDRKLEFKVAINTLMTIYTSHLRTLSNLTAEVASKKEFSSRISDFLDTKRSHLMRTVPTDWHKFSRWFHMTKDDAPYLLGLLVEDLDMPFNKPYEIRDLGRGHLKIQETTDFTITDMDLAVLAQNALEGNHIVRPQKYTIPNEDTPSTFQPVRFRRRELVAVPMKDNQILLERYQRLNRIPKLGRLFMITGVFTISGCAVLGQEEEFLIAINGNEISLGPTDLTTPHDLQSDTSSTLHEISNLNVDHDTLQQRLRHYSSSSSYTARSGSTLTNIGLERRDYAASSVSSTARSISNTDSESTASPLSSNYHTFRDALAKELDWHEIGIETKGNYFPDHQYGAFVNSSRIKEAFPTIHSSLVEFITELARKTFLITVLSISSGQVALKAMTAFQRHRFTDESLPVEKLTSKSQNDSAEYCTHNWTAKSDEYDLCDICDAVPTEKGSCTHDRLLNVFHHAFWDRLTFNMFFDKQWAFLVQKFNKDVFIYDDLDTRCILPFLSLERDSSASAGYFSEVKPVSALTDCFDFTPPEDSEGEATIIRKDDIGRSFVTIALKSLRPLGESYYDIAREWQKEAYAHRHLNDLGHPHIIKGLGAFRHHGSYHLMLEWADGGSLQEFWRVNPKPVLNRQHIAEVLKQLHGISDALRCMHNTKAAPSRSLSRRSANRNVPVFTPGTSDLYGESGRQQEKIEGFSRLSNLDTIPTIVISEALDITPEIELEAGYVEHWRHGDINPSNIVRFTDPHSWLGNLKLADFGRAKQHSAITSMRSIVEIDLWRTKKYEAPDYFIYGQTRSVSRLYDVWSLGCVFFEAIVWLLYGYQELHEFEGSTSWVNVEGSPYWQRTGPEQATVSDMATLWMDYILKYDPECSTLEGSALGDLMRLVQTKMLVVKLPTGSYSDIPEFRTDAADVVRNLEIILEKSNSNDLYLFTGNSRQLVKPPPSGQPVSGPPLGSLQSNLLAPLIIPDPNSRPLDSRLNAYTYTLGTSWTIEPDLDFVTGVVHDIAPNKEAVFELTGNLKSSKLCGSCSTLSFQDLVFDNYTKKVSDYRLTSSHCDLCGMIYRASERGGIRSSDFVHLKVDAGLLRLNGKNASTLRLCRALWDENLAEKSRRIEVKTRQLLFGEQFEKPLIPFGLPRVPHPFSSMRIHIMKSWLSDCDMNHKCMVREGERFFPKRLFLVPSSRLVDTDDLSETERRRIRYVALSYCRDSTLYSHSATYIKNLEDQRIKVELDELPVTVRKAISITALLGINFIWIDFICIIQDDPFDVDRNVQNMGEIYNSAYTVIAASDSNGPISDNPYLDHAVVALPSVNSTEVSGSSVFISELCDDFDHDVLESNLSQRAWALQEHALAPRSIFLTDSQMYWECGEGVRCGTLTKMRNEETRFLGDPQFPSYAVGQGQPIGSSLFFFTRLYELYSHLSYSVPTDRPVAIIGLEQRLTQYLHDSSGAGVFQSHSHRWLLWKRAEDVHSLDPIEFGSSRYSRNIPPSWSWMAYSGGISYLQPPSGMIRWNKDIHLVLTGNKKVSWLYSDEKLEMKAPVVNVAWTDIGVSRDSSITYDAASKARPPEMKCIIIGTIGDPQNPGSRHYVLVVRPKNTTADTTSFERIGAGYLPQRLILGLDYSNSLVVIE